MADCRGRQRGSLILPNLGGVSGGFGNFRVDSWVFGGIARSFERKFGGFSGNAKYPSP